VVSRRAGLICNNVILNLPRRDVPSFVIRQDRHRRRQYRAGCQGQVTDLRHDPVDYWDHRHLRGRYRGDGIPSLMLDIRLNIQTSKEAEGCLPDLRAKIMSSGISDQEQTFLLDTITSNTARCSRPTAI
jgi:hypothetical protein